MIRLERSGFSSLGKTVPIAQAFGARKLSAPLSRPSMAQAAPPSPRVLEARTMLEAAIRDLESAQERFTFLETSMGTEAAIEALEQGERSVELRQEDYARALEEAVERVENSVP